ncbi:MAG: energy transducer TonB, partial [Proteobacteria bacterium]|nr:energy transducer TonB [Pseudomonadota bacterium]
LLYVLGFLPFSNKSIQEESILVDFTLMDGKEGAGGRGERSGNREQGAGREGARFNPAGGGTMQKKEGADLRQSNSPAMSKSIEKDNVTGVTQDKVQTSSIDLVSLHPTPGQRGRGGEADGSSQKGGGTGSDGTDHGRGGGTGKTSGSSGGEGGSRPHDYGYVREIVMKHLKYPEKARRMGLEGRVVMSFIITAAGVARDIKVVESSGFQMLDDAASDAISRVNLSHSNPHRLIVHLPVEFRLR